MRRLSMFALPALLVGLAAALAAADDPAATLRAYAIGEAVGDFTLKDMDGKTFSLAASRQIGSEKALSVVVSAAKAAGSAEPKAEDAVDALPAVMAGSTVDAAKRLAWVRGVAKDWGFYPNEEKAKSLKTLSDVARWLETAAEAPIVLACWKAACPTTHMYEERIHALFGDGKARLYVLATGTNETDAEIAALVKERGLPWRILDDRALGITERLGGKRTPHWFVLDAKNALRYSGSLDDDPREDKKPAERIDYLARALGKIADGMTPEILMTEPVG